MYGENLGRMPWLVNVYAVVRVVWQERCWLAQRLEDRKQSVINPVRSHAHSSLLPMKLRIAFPRKRWPLANGPKLARVLEGGHPYLPSCRRPSASQTSSLYRARACMYVQSERHKYPVWSSGFEPVIEKMFSTDRHVYETSATTAGI